MVTNFLKEPQKAGITDDEGIWKGNMKNGMWNAITLFWSGALKVIHTELSNLDFDVVVFQETRLESGIQKFDNFALFNSGLVSTGIGLWFLCKWRIFKICQRFQNYK